MKNISESMLDVNADSLTERFVRGDESRSTEGSGLGLSISKMLTELMGGQFDIELEDDLFRVKVTFQCEIA
jgi:signal transduction histidine kinase